MSEITLIFPDQLFSDHPAIQSDRTIYLVEEFLFFKVQLLHKQKILLMKAAMREFEKCLLAKKLDVVYISTENLNQRGELFDLLAKAKIKKIHLAEFADEWLREDLTKAAQENAWSLKFYPSPGFLCSEQDLKAFFADQNHYSMAHFYVYQRRRLGILMDGSKPIGGKFSFDVENRKKIPQNMSIPKHDSKKHHDFEKSILEIENEIPKTYGTSDSFSYPTNHAAAKKVLLNFLETKLSYFGDYQDAMRMEDSILFHSVLSPSLNIGLITPGEVITITLNFAKKHPIPLNSLEGFIRQIIGWREFVRASYLLKGSHQRSINYFNHAERIPKSFWNGTTGILPIDTLVKKLHETGYCNHIERLMVLGNFLLLTETAPNEVYEWFMAAFIDSYDWVMVPNVYGMTQYADGGLIVTKPYISGSNYILKMSNYPKGAWTEIWDGLFWRFIQLHHNVFSTNPRTRPMVYSLDKNKATLSKKIEIAEKWLIDYRSNSPENTKRSACVPVSTVHPHRGPASSC